MVLARYNGGGIETHSAAPLPIAVVEPRARQQLRYVEAAREAKVGLELRFVADLAEMKALAGAPSEPMAGIIVNNGLVEVAREQFPALPVMPSGAVAERALTFAGLLTLMAETEQFCQRAQAASVRS